MNQTMLKDYIIRAKSPKDYYPSIELSHNGVFKIIGSSFMENALQFYDPIFEWVAAFTTTKKPAQLHLLLDYYNTASVKCFDMLLRDLEAYAQNGNQVEVFWYYEEEDTDNMADGEDFDDLIDLLFHIVPFTKGNEPISI